MSQPVVINLDLPADHRYLNTAGACLAAMIERIDAVSDRDMASYSIQLAIQETCANIVDHAYEKPSAGRIHIELILLADPRRLMVEIYDMGKAFDPALVQEPNLEQAQVRGYGLFLMRHLMDEITYERQPGRNHWRLVKSL